MLKLINKNNLILKKNIFNALDKYICKILLCDNTIIYLLYREKIRKFFNKFNRSSSLTYFRKTCYLTNRTKGNRTLFHMSRLKIKALA